MPGALDGIRVIDFGHYLAGPLAAVMLADQGAEVIHVDPPGGPRWNSPADAFLNRGKQRVTLDLKQPDDLERARQLIADADVLIENFRPGVMDRLGLGAAELTEQHEGLVYCSLPGFGSRDPRAGMQAWEGVIHAATDNCTPRPGEEPPDWDWSRPFYSAVPLASNFAAFLGATSVVMALIARERTGRGQQIEVPLFDAMFQLIGHQAAYLHDRGLHPAFPIHQWGAGAFVCADGRSVQFDTFSPRHLIWFAQAAGITDWGPDFLDVTRLRDPKLNDQLHARLRELFLTRPAEEWERIGNAAGGCISVARTVEEWINTEHARSSGAVVQLEDPEYGPTWMAGLPVHLSETPGGAQGPRQLPDSNLPSDVSWSESGAARGATLEPNGDPLRTKLEELAAPLQGLKVLDLCLALAGPTCGRLLLEYGADTIKISPPKKGVGGYLNRGKRSLLIDLESFAGQEVFWRLVDEADVVLENFSPGTADRLGVGYREVRARNPRAIYTSISAYGPNGPFSNQRGWERQGQAVSGIMERTSDPASVLGPYNMVDHGTGMLGTFATALALYHRQRTGESQHAFASLAWTGTYHQTPYMLSFEGYEATEPRGYEALGTGPLDRFYQANDGWLFMAVHPDDAHRLASVPGFEGIDLEGPGLEQELEQRFAADSVAAHIERLHAAGIAAHRWVSVAELADDPVSREQGLSVTQEIEGQGLATMPGLSAHFSLTPMRLGEPPHRPGSDAPAILEEIGLADQLEPLERAWALQASDLPAAW